MANESAVLSLGFVVAAVWWPQTANPVTRQDILWYRRTPSHLLRAAGGLGRVACATAAAGGSSAAATPICSTKVCQFLLFFRTKPLLKCIPVNLIASEQNLGSVNPAELLKSLGE